MEPSSSSSSSDSKLSSSVNPDGSESLLIVSNSSCVNADSKVATGHSSSGGGVLSSASGDAHTASTNAIIEKKASNSDIPLSSSSVAASSIPPSASVVSGGDGQLKSVKNASLGVAHSTPSNTPVVALASSVGIGNSSSTAVSQIPPTLTSSGTTTTAGSVGSSVISKFESQAKLLVQRETAEALKIAHQRESSTSSSTVGAAAAAAGQSKNSSDPSRQWSVPNPLASLSSSAPSVAPAGLQQETPSQNDAKISQATNNASMVPESSTSVKVSNGSQPSIAVSKIQPSIQKLSHEAALIAVATATQKSQTPLVKLDFPNIPESLPSKASQNLNSPANAAVTNTSFPVTGATPNPLSSSTVPTTNSAVLKSSSTEPKQQLPINNPLTGNSDPNALSTTIPVPSPAAAATTTPNSNASAPNNNKARPRIVLSKAAKTALSKAVISAIKSPTGQIDPTFLQQAIITGLPEHAVLSAAKTAVMRHAQTKKESQSTPTVKSGTNIKATVPNPMSQTTPVITAGTQQHQQKESDNNVAAINRLIQERKHSNSATPTAATQNLSSEVNKNKNVPFSPVASTTQPQSLQQQQQRDKNLATKANPKFSITPVKNLSQIKNSQFNVSNPLALGSKTETTSSVSSNNVALQNHTQTAALQNVRPKQVVVQQVKPQRPVSQQQQQMKQTMSPQAAAAYKAQVQRIVGQTVAGTSNSATVKAATAPVYATTKPIHQAQTQQKQQQLVYQRSAPKQNVTGSSTTAKYYQNQQGKQMYSAQNPQNRTMYHRVATPAPNPFMHWKRLMSGMFVSSGNKRLIANIGCMVQSDCVLSPAVLHEKYLRSVQSSPKIDSDILKDAASIQRKLLQQNQSNQKKEPLSTNITAKLMDPEQFKRIKIQPKKESKNVEKVLKKSRSNTCRNMIKNHKNFLKTIVAHQGDFFKFHRNHRSELSRLARSIRDHVNKTAKKKEKDADNAERARIAALKANDMNAYRELVEDTKNERLRFLLDKTGEYIHQISQLLSEERGVVGSTSGSSSSTNNINNTSYYSSAHVKTEEVRQPSILVGGELKEYQLAGLQWLVSLYNNRLNGILADEMGLGKTIQTISLIAYLMEIKENRGPFLVIVPLSTLSNWVNEFSKWCPAAYVITYKGTPSQRKEIFREEVSKGRFNVLLTTYEYIIKDKGYLKKVPWEYAIVDEGHRMKNAQSKFATILGSQYTTRNRILLTGTPLQNNLPELWALLNFLLPSIFNSVESFDQWFNRPFSQFGSTAAAAEEDKDEILSNEERMLIIHRLHELLRPFMLRRVKSEVLHQLPEKVEKILRCELSSWQKFLYQQISVNASAESGLANGDKSVAGKNIKVRGMNNIVMQLRKVCNHPYLFSKDGYHINDTLIRSSGKFSLLDRMLPKLKAAGHRVLMFTQMTALMPILEDYFYYRGYASLRLDGSTPADEREKRMYKFNAPDSPYFIFLLSTRAGGLGLNLASADTVIIFDSDWNPMMDLQAQDRAHRIGQRNEVRVFRLVTYSPVEEKILSRATDKLNMSEIVVEAGKFDRSSVDNEDNAQERRKLMEILLTDFDSNNMNQSSNDNDTDSQNDGTAEEKEIDDVLNEQLSGNDEEYDLYKQLDKEAIKTNTLLSLFKDLNDVPDWIKYPDGKKQKEEEETDSLMLGTKRRKAATNTVMYDDGLTEHKFIKLMEKEAQRTEEEAAKQKELASKKASAAQRKSTTSSIEHLSDWTTRKLIGACKSVIALREPSTKRRFSEIFLEKPCAKTYPDYYQIIQKPIGINDILKKCRAKKYEKVNDFVADWKLLFTNARTYNPEGSWVVLDSQKLEAELYRYMDNNGVQREQATISSESQGLKIKLSIRTKASKGEDEGSKKSKGTSLSKRKSTQSSEKKSKRRRTM